MEIINCIQTQPAQRKFSLPVFERKHKNSYNSASVFVYSPYKTELKSFNLPKVKNPVSVKGVLSNIGKGISSVQEFCKKNAKALLISSGVLFCTVTTGITVTFVSAYFKNNTGAIKLQSEDSLDIENLNKLMQTFALEGLADYDESGKLNNTSTNVAKYIQPVTYQTYKVQRGDTISGIARKFGLTNISTLISVNDIGNVRQLAAGQKLKIPSMDGIIYVVKSGDSLESVVKKYGLKMNHVLDVNELSTEKLNVGQVLFLPGAVMDSKALKTALGDKFIIPIQGKFRWTSPFGRRIDPIAGVVSNHTGTDMACPTGTPIVASMSGKVTATGINRVYGNYVIIDHGNGYQTLYAHMSKIIATKGQWVSQGTRIGLVGSTGYSTGPHLHFTVYKNGKLVDPMTVLK